MALSRRILAVTAGLVAMGLLGSIGLKAYVQSMSDQLVKQGDRSLVVDHAPQEAEKMARWVLRFTPDHHDALLLLGVSLNRQNRYDEAVDVFESAKHSVDFSPDAAYARAACLMLSGRYEDAEVELVTLLESLPHHDDARNLLRQLLEKTYRFHDAAALVQNRFRNQPDDLRYLTECLKVSVAFPLGQAVVPELSDFNKRHPAQPTVIAGLARAHWLKGNIAESAALFNELLKLDELTPGQLAWAAEFWVEAGDIDKAQVAAARMDVVAKLQEHPDHIKAQAESARASLASSQRNFSDAELHLTRAISLAPDHAEYYLRRADIRRRLRKVDAAIEDTTSGKQTARTSEELRRRSGRIELGELTPEICREVATLYTQRRQQGSQELSNAWLELADALTPINY
jgi:tetratricopeptide (TPR) repeat protein